MHINQITTKSKQFGWYDFYKNTPKPTNENELFKNKIYKNQNQRINAPDSTNIYVYNSLFIDFTSNGSGSVVYYSKEGGKLLVELTIFSNCSAQLHGGCIYAEKCNCVINYVCSIGCYQTQYDGNYGQFIRTYSINESQLNYVLYTSVCSTPETPQGNGAPIDLLFGEEQCKYVNVSNYYVNEYSALFLKSKAEITNVSFCSFVSNYATDSNCAYFDSLSSVSYEIYSCNFINNTHASEDNGLITSIMNITFDNCNFIDNSAQYLFRINEYKTLSLINSHVSNNNYTSIAGFGIITTENMLQESIANSISFVDCEHLLKRYRITVKISIHFPFSKILRFSFILSVCV